MTWRGAVGASAVAAAALALAFPARGAWASTGHDLGSTVYDGTTLQAGDYLQSANGAYTLLMQGDGNLVQYASSGQALWATGTSGNSSAHAVLQADGDLVVYGPSGQALWQSGTSGYPGDAGDHLNVGNLGVVALYTSGGTPLWAARPAAPAASPPLNPGAAQAPDGQEMVAVTSPQGDVQAVLSTQTGGWSTSIHLGGRALGGPAVASPGNGVFDVFVRGMNDAVWEDRYSSGSWSGWRSLGGVVLASPGASSDGGQVYVVARGQDSGLWERLADTSSSWQRAAGASHTAAGPAPALDATGDMAITYEDSTGALWAYRAGAWTNLQATAAGDPGASSFAYGEEEVFTRMADGHIWHRWWNLDHGGVPYENPLRAVKGLQAYRIDQGVDYGDSAPSPIYAIGQGVVTMSTTKANWPGGGWVVYQLTAGPASGMYVYVAENVVPRVKVGQKVSASTVVATLNPGWPDMETGWAAPYADQAYAGYTNQYVEGELTAPGENFSDLLQVIGAPGGQREGRLTTGWVPQSWPTWGHWSGWVSLGGSLRSGPAAAVAPGSDRQDVFAVDGEGRLWQVSDLKGQWGNWRRVP